MIATWKFSGPSVDLGSRLLSEGASAVETVEESIKLLELENEEQYYVGVGGYPNAEGTMEFDGAMMDHHSNYGAVLGLQEAPLSRSQGKLWRTVFTTSLLAMALFNLQ